MNLTPKTNSPLKLRFALTPSGMETAGSFELVNYNVAKIDVVTGSRLVDICNSEGEDYRYGFNTQEKTNEIAGIGNHNTAFFGELDTRLGRRWNLDPKPSPSISTYSVFGNNPIFYSDILLDTPSHEPQKGQCEGCKVQTLADGDYFSDVQDQTYTAVFTGVKESLFKEFKGAFAQNPGEIINNGLAEYDLIDRDGSYGVSKGDHFDINIYGPDEGSVIVTNVKNSEYSLSITVKTLEGHPDAGVNTFSMSYDPKSKSMTWSTHNVSRTKDGILGIGAGMVNARWIQQRQWRFVMEQVHEIIGFPKVSSATATIKEYDYNDYTDKIGALESSTTIDLKKKYGY